MSQQTAAATLRLSIKAKITSPGSPKVFVGTVRFIEEQPLASAADQANRDQAWTAFALRLATGAGRR